MGGWGAVLDELLLIATSSLDRWGGLSLLSAHGESGDASQRAKGNHRELFARRQTINTFPPKPPDLRKIGRRGRTYNMRTDLPSGDGVNSNHFDGGGSIGDSGGIV